MLSSKLSVAEEKRSSQLQEVKDKLGEHMEKIEKAQKELEHQLEVNIFIFFSIWLKVLMDLDFPNDIALFLFDIFVRFAKVIITKK